MQTIDSKAYSKSRLEVKMNSITLQMFFETESKMTFTIIDGGEKIESGYTETAKTKIIKLRTNLFLITWKEISGAAISQVQYLENELVYTNITMPNGKFYQTKGTIKYIK